MPVTFLPSDPHSLVGPGLPFQVSTDSTSWSSPPATWEIQVYGGSGFANQFWTEHWPYTSTVQNETLGLGTLQPNVIAPTYWASTDDSVKVGVYLRDSAGDDLEDTVVSSLTWDNAQGLPVLIQNQTGSGGLTVTQADQLENASTNSDTAIINWDNYTSVTLPSLNDLISSILAGVTTPIIDTVTSLPKTIGSLFGGHTVADLARQEITDGEQCADWSATIVGGPIYALMIEFTTVPDFYAFTGPGSTYSQQVLGVIEIDRGEDGLLRRGLHTTKDMFYPLPGVWQGILDLDFPLAPPDYTIRVWPNTGVCFHVYGLRVP